MKTRLSLVIGAFILAGTCAAADSQHATLNQALERVSERIGEHVNTRSIAQSLYRQIRPHVLITDHKLGKAAINQRVRSYVDKKFMPMLILRYTLAYGKMKTASGQFSPCSKINPFAYSPTTNAALCTVRNDKQIHVRYLLNEQGKGWKPASEFIFRQQNKGLELYEIRLELNKFQTFKIDGL